MEFSAFRDCENLHLTIERESNDRRDAMFVFTRTVIYGRQAGEEPLPVPPGEEPPPPVKEPPDKPVVGPDGPVDEPRRRQPTRL
jgi:hypothetical protein